MEWHAIQDELPAGEVLIWSRGFCAIAVLVPEDKSGPAAFMDARSELILPWPEYWMPVPCPSKE